MKKTLIILKNVCLWCFGELLIGIFINFTLSNPAPDYFIGLLVFFWGTFIYFKADIEVDKED